MDHLIPPGVNPDEVGYIDPLSNLTWWEILELYIFTFIYLYLFSLIYLFFVYPPASVPVSIPISTYIYTCMSIPFFVYIYISIYRSIPPFVYSISKVFIHLCVSICIYISLYIYIYNRNLYPSICRCISPSFSLSSFSLYLFVYRSIHPPTHTYL